MKRSPLLAGLVILMGAHGDVNQPPEVGFVSLASCEVTKKEVGWYAKARAEYANPEKHNGGRAWEKVIAIEGDAERAARDCGKWVEETGKAQRKANGAKGRGRG